MNGAYSSRRSPRACRRTGNWLAFMSRRQSDRVRQHATPGAASCRRGGLPVPVRRRHRTTRLVCAPATRREHSPKGVYDTSKAGEGIGLLDRPARSAGALKWAGWTTGWRRACPGGRRWASQARATTSRATSDDNGRLYFNSAEALVPRRRQTARSDVYEYEPRGSRQLLSSENTSRGGCVALITSGTSERESAFLDASESGNDVFFLTSAKLAKSRHGHGNGHIRRQSLWGGRGTNHARRRAAQPPSRARRSVQRADLLATGHTARPPAPRFSGSGNQQREEPGIARQKPSKRRRRERRSSRWR